MRQIIKNQLEKVKVANLCEWDQNTTHIVIEQSISKDPKSLEVDHYYIISIADYVIHEPQGFTLSKNWNGGQKPTCSCMKCCVDKIMGQMIKVTGVGYDLKNKVDLDASFEGWLPMKSITVEGVLQ